MSQKLPLPRWEIIGRKSAVLVAKQIRGDHEQPISRTVNENPKRSIPLQLSIFDHRNFFENGIRRVILGNGNLADTTVHETNQKPTAEIVPFGALPEEAGAVIVIDMGRGLSELERDEKCDRNGWKYEESEETSGGANGHGCSGSLLLLRSMGEERKWWVSGSKLRRLKWGFGDGILVWNFGWNGIEVTMNVIYSFFFFFFFFSFNFY